jgi:hypothetical protein
VRPRGRLTLDFGRLFGGAENRQPPTPVTSDIDLFRPPDHIHWLEACTALQTGDANQSLTQIAARLGIGHMTVKRAFDYARLMNLAGTATPYRELTERPAKASRWHPKQPSQ